MRIIPSVLLCPLALACQPAPSPPPSVAPNVTVEPPADSAVPATPTEQAPISPEPPSGYLTRDYGCEPLDERAGEELLKRANAAIERAGEHPTDADLGEILPLLHRAAYGGHVGAQRRYGYYVVGYWFTDEMFWPQDEPVAVSALAMARVAAIHDRAENGGPLDDPLREALASTPVVFSDPDQLTLPDDWVAAGVAEADAWQACVAKR